MGSTPCVPNTYILTKRGFYLIANPQSHNQTQEFPTIVSVNAPIKAKDINIG